MQRRCGGDLTAEQVFAEHRRWGEVVKKEYADHVIMEHANTKDPERRLKIGHNTDHAHARMHT